jgi:HAD superfamily hydrolase (TIGR01509 family)
LGDEIRRTQSIKYAELSRRLTPTPGAQDLLLTLKKRGLHVVLASSGARQDTRDAISLLEADQWIDAWVCGDDTDQSKPDPEPVSRAVDAVGGHRALVIGDSTWDMESAARAGHPAVGVLTGSIAESELLGAGAVEVFEDPSALCALLDSLLAKISSGSEV